MRIYISGAITGTEDFRERFLEAEKELIAVGHDTVNPARLNDIMPKDAARIWLKVADVQVERLHDITGKSVLREGINSHVHPDADYFDGNQREVFAELWDSTIKKSDIDRYGWNANPWVWVIDFERCDKPKEE